MSRDAIEVGAFTSSRIHEANRQRLERRSLAWRGTESVTRIIGIDCAAQAKNTGLVLAEASEETLHVTAGQCGSTHEEPAKVIAGWIGQADRVLLALDAPLGWPTPLGTTLVSHEAGGALGPTPNMAPTAHQMFRRQTDDAIYDRLGKRPFDVGADRIARASHSALKLLETIRQTVGLDIPLAWSNDWGGRVAAIEVYPAATRLGLGLPKVPKSGNSLDGLHDRLLVAPTVNLESEHVRDAVLCALSGLEFLLGRAKGPSPDERSRALKEGWIWAP